MYTVVTTTISTKELEQISSTLFGMKYDYLNEEGVGVSIPVRLFDITNDTPLDWELWDKFIAGQRFGMVHLLLAVLVMMGRIPAGKIVLQNSYFFSEE
jgi:hypothetical protein